MPENTRPDHTQPENTEPDNTQQDSDQHLAADPAGAARPDDSGGQRSGPHTVGEPSTSAPEWAEPSAAAAGDAGEVSTTYERTSEGHRVTRRTIRRREVSEDTHETIDESYPVPTPYAAPTPDHPTPVG
jgi:hypothetical protein